MVYKASSKQFRCMLYVEIFVRPMRYKGCHQAHNAKVVICAFFAMPNSLNYRSGHMSGSQSIYSITSSAVKSNSGGISTPRALAVLRLIAISNFVGCSTGRSAGFSPLRIRPA
jgi:hypothetical protein